MSRDAGLAWVIIGLGMLLYGAVVAGIGMIIALFASRTPGL